MQLKNGLIIAVVDGEILNLYRNTSDEQSPSLSALPSVELAASNSGSGARHQSSAANPDNSRHEEDGFAASVADHLNKQVLAGNFQQLFIIAAPKTLGELRKHYHQKLQDALVGELAKDLTGHSISDIETALGKA